MTADVRTMNFTNRLDDEFASRWRNFLMYCKGGSSGGGMIVVQVTLVKR